MSLISRGRSDFGLLKSYLRGNYEAFETLYLRHSEALFNYIYRSLGTYAVAEEIAQDVWMVVLNKADTFTPGASAFKTWLYTIARNRVIDYQRRKVNRPHGDIEELDLPAQELDHETQLLLQQLLITLNELPEEQRESFMLLQEGFSHREIADITGVGSETVKSRLRYAKTFLKKQLRAEA